MKEFSPFTSIATVVIAVCLISVALFKSVPQAYLTRGEKDVIVRRPGSIVGKVLRIKETHNDGRRNYGRAVHYHGYDYKVIISAV